MKRGKADIVPQDDLLKVAKFNAQKFALLLHICALPDEVKEAIVALLPEMPTEQINELLNILESRYLDEQTKDIDEKYEKELKEFINSLEEKQEKTDEDFAQKIEMITKSI